MGAPSTRNAGGALAARAGGPMLILAPRAENAPTGKLPELAEPVTVGGSRAPEARSQAGSLPEPRGGGAAAKRAAGPAERVLARAPRGGGARREPRGDATGGASCESDWRRGARSEKVCGTRAPSPGASGASRHFEVLPSRALLEGALGAPAPRPWLQEREDKGSRPSSADAAARWRAQGWPHSAKLAVRLALRPGGGAAAPGAESSAAGARAARARRGRSARTVSAGRAGRWRLPREEQGAEGVPEAEAPKSGRAPPGSGCKHWQAPAARPSGHGRALAYRRGPARTPPRQVPCSCSWQGRVPAPGWQREASPSRSDFASQNLGQRGEASARSDADNGRWRALSGRCGVANRRNWRSMADRSTPGLS